MWAALYMDGSDAGGVSWGRLPTNRWFHMHLATASTSLDLDGLVLKRSVSDH